MNTFKVEILAADRDFYQGPCLSLVIPCIIVGAFQIDSTPELLQGLALSLGTAIGIHVLFFVFTALLRRPLHLTPVEQASVIYSNCGNLIIPLVTATLGPQWVVFSSMYQLVQQFPLWSHCRILLSGDRTISLKKIFLNVNILSVFDMVKVHGGFTKEVRDAWRGIREELHMEREEQRKQRESRVPAAPFSSSDSARRAPASPPRPHPDGQSAPRTRARTPAAGR